MIFPCMLYKVPGPHGPRPGYRFIGCNDQEQYEALIADGWHFSKAAAMGKVEAEKVIEAAEELEDAIDEISPATRDELEAKAKELGVSFNHRTKDEVLAKRIAEKL